ncbi:chemokine-like protein orion isoform X2 [Lycorma delicatula]|uniref:chemokine-like protein orion isoform X2 n=1 Tax=Lycorma delicatula TaxID=130591 RepID=UPI003F510F45
MTTDRRINVIITIFLYILTIISQNKIDAKQTKLSEIDQLRISTIHRISRLWRKLSHQEWEKIAELRGGKDVKLLEEYNKICETFNNVQLGPIPELLVSPIWSYAIIEVETTGIIGLYKNFRQHQHSPESDKNQRKWQDFAENVLQDTVDTASVSKAMDRIGSIIEGDNQNSNIYEQILKEIGSNLCNVQQSPQQVIYNIYTSLQMTQLKGYTMMQFSWMLLRLYNKGNFTLEANKSKEKYLHRMRLQVQMAKKAMSDADQSMWRCDPYKYVEDETYTQLTRLLQGYIQNEIDLNNEETCRENCQYYSYTKQFGCYKDNFCSQQRNCNGRIVDCKFIDSDMTVCQAETMSNERYRWIEYKNGEKLGDLSQSCARVTKVDSWWRYLFWHCSYCLCICDDPYFSDRYFNLRPVTSNVEENMVVTAIRFIKVDHIIHLQIQEGKMLPKGIINETTLSWRPVDEYKIDITGVRNKDYHMMSWEERGIDLDELTAPQNHVLTGVKFRKLGTHLNLEIRITPFNFSNGLLIKPKEKSEWISNDNTDGASESPRTEVKLKAPDVPTKHPFNNRPDSQKDQFLIFTYTDIYKDIAQHTVPYIDTQIVGPQPPTPLSGVGLMHKGMDGSGGFISPKVFTYNMAPHLQEDFEEI